MRTDVRIKCKKINEKGEKLLQNKTIALAGVGAVGSTIASMLAREGIHLRMVDMGRVEEEDMHRLTIFYEEDITKFKVKQAKLRLNAINPHVQVKSFHEEIGSGNVFLLQGDVVIDATNSDEVNKLTIPYAAKKKLPFILIRCSGTQAKILVMQHSLPAKTLDKLKLPSQDKDGIFGPITTLAASIVVSQVIKILVGDKGSYIIECDAWDEKIKITKI